MLHRRDAMLRVGQLGLGSLTLPGLLHFERQAVAAYVPPKKVKHCIYVFLWGGPPQQDLWDLKPEAPEGIRSHFKPIATRVPGISICDQMPLLAKQMDRVALIRSLTHDSNIHEPSVYRMLTGHQDSTLVVPRNQRKRSEFPSVGSVVSQFSEPADLPATVTIPRPIGHNGVTYAGTYAGFLGPRHDPMELQAAKNSNDQPLHAVTLPEEVSTTRLHARRGLLNVMEANERRLQHSRAADGLGGFTEQAFRMVTSPAAKRAFKIDHETPAMRDRYGRNEYGESMLLARRMVEAGVRLVSVVWMYIFPHGQVSNVWDNHSGLNIYGSKTGYDLLRSPVCIPPLDRGLSALIDDLSQRGLLDDTLIVAVGEFGRTPQINKDAGRDHWGACQSVLLAGGGIKGGQVYGSSDKNAAYPKDNPVSPEDLLATIYHSMGLPEEAEIRDRAGRPYRVTDGKPITALF